MGADPRHEPARPEHLARLREAGLRATGPRLLILEALRRSHDHPTPEQVLLDVRRRYPSLSLSTVYQTFETFVKAGLCRRVATHDGRLRVDGTPRDHDHAICRDCGGVFDVARRAPATRTARGLPDGCAVLEVRVEYDIVCADCASG